MAENNNSSMQLKLHNHFTGKKEVFTPRSGLNVTWYSCGPTVYGASHMGHAHSYISFDILRRVLKDHFGYNITYVMNITDIDGEIIKRARQQHLYENYARQDRDGEAFRLDVKEALDRLINQIKTTTDPDKKIKQKEMLTKVVAGLEKFCGALDSKNGLEQAQQSLLIAAKDVLCDWLESKLGSGVTGNAIFTSFPRYWEEQFHKDMATLNILPADLITRVSDYVPEIVDSIKYLIDQGLAYEANGSVYFNSDAEARQKGEADLSVSEDRTSEKKSHYDFSLWRASQRGEPSWDSPWGKGRPHSNIVFNVKKSETLVGSPFDIITGGIDLEFSDRDFSVISHRDYSVMNVRYLLHTTLLTIAGFKMSKSLKNFITIQDALKRNSSRELRIFFLLHQWCEMLDYSDSAMEEAANYEKMLSDFFCNVQEVVQNGQASATSTEYFQKWGPAEMELHSKCIEEENKVRSALCDNIDTKTALEALRRIMTSTNEYLVQLKQSANRELLKSVAEYVTRLFRTFGVVEGNQVLGFSSDSGLRRDGTVPYSVVQMEDRQNQPGAPLKLVPREDKKMANEAKKPEKERTKRATKEAKKNDKRRIPPKELFKSQTDKYSAFDEDGVPTKDKEGKELSKSKVNKLKKLLKAQERVHASYLQQRTDVKVTVSVSPAPPGEGKRRTCGNCHQKGHLKRVCPKNEGAGTRLPALPSSVDQEAAKSVPSLPVDSTQPPNKSTDKKRKGSLAYIKMMERAEKRKKN